MPVKVDAGCFLGYSRRIGNAIMSKYLKRHRNSPLWRRFLLAGVTLIAVSSCAGIRSRYHYVEPGDSLATIASRYDIPVAELRQHNKEVLEQGIREGMKLYIPFEEDPRWNSDLVTQSGRAPSSDVPSEVAVDFKWPVAGSVSSLFGNRTKRRRQSGFHEGIDIAAPRGTPVKAARAGHVIYAGNRIRGYGNMIIVRHMDDYSTVYAHLSKMNVKKGQFIARGQKLGAVGRTGHASGTHLHFEIREKQTPLDPLLFLQGQYATNTLGR